MLVRFLAHNKQVSLKTPVKSVKVILERRYLDNREQVL